ncbi:MAG: hypothetical protein ABEJ96_08440, partial [Thiohalorhabdaceae bacterium]
MGYRTVTGTGLILLAVTFLFASGTCTAGESYSGKDIPRSQYSKMAPEELAEYLIFNRGFKVDQKIPESQGGGKVAKRMKQDKI